MSIPYLDKDSSDPSLPMNKGSRPASETRKRLLNRLAFETDHYIDVMLKYHHGPIDLVIPLTRSVVGARENRHAIVDDHVAPNGHRRMNLDFHPPQKTTFTYQQILSLALQIQSGTSGQTHNSHPRTP